MILIREHRWSPLNYHWINYASKSSSKKICNKMYNAPQFELHCTSTWPYKIALAMAGVVKQLPIQPTYNQWYKCSHNRNNDRIPFATQELLVVDRKIKRTLIVRIYGQELSYQCAHCNSNWSFYIAWYFNIQFGQRSIIVAEASCNTKNTSY